MKITEVIKEKGSQFLKDHWKIVLVSFLGFLAIFAVIQLIWGIKSAITATFVYFSAIFGLVKKKQQIKKLKEESKEERKVLKKDVEKIVQNVNDADIIIDKQIEKDAAPKQDPSQDKEDVLSLLDDLNKGSK